MGGFSFLPQRLGESPPVRQFFRNLLASRRLALEREARKGGVHGCTHNPTPHKPLVPLYARSVKALRLLWPTHPTHLAHLPKPRLTIRRRRPRNLHPLAPATSPAIVVITSTPITNLNHASLRIALRSARLRRRHVVESSRCVLINALFSARRCVQHELRWHGLRRLRRLREDGGSEWGDNKEKQDISQSFTHNTTSMASMC